MRDTAHDGEASGLVAERGPLLGCGVESRRSVAGLAMHTQRRRGQIRDTGTECLPGTVGRLRGSPAVAGGAGVGCGDEGAAIAEPAMPGDDVDVAEGGGPAGGAAGEGDGAVENDRTLDLSTERSTSMTSQSGLSC